MFNIANEKIKEELLNGSFGIEMEGLRVTYDGHMSHKKHPFGNDSRIERDFCENQTEINTEVAGSAEEAYEALYGYVKKIRSVLNEMEEPELLWPFSNPPYIINEEDIPIAQYEGERFEKTTYREYLGNRYGKYKMTFSGVHINYSFSDKLIEEAAKEAGADNLKEFKNSLYLKLAECAESYGWIVTALTAASPIVDSSFYETGDLGKTVFSGMASIRCSESGYWNNFTPLLDYDSLESYIDSINKYIENGNIIAPSELYYPVRLKPKGLNTLENLSASGINHIELRMVDLNPLDKAGLNVCDIKFVELLMVYLIATKKSGFDKSNQFLAIQNFKSAAHYDLATVHICFPNGVSKKCSEAGIYIIEEMIDFYKDIDQTVIKILEFEKRKFESNTNRYAYIIRKEYENDYVIKGLRLAKDRNADI